MKELEEVESYNELAKKYKKSELIERSLAAFDKLAEILQLVAVALPELEGMSPVQRTLYDSAKAREIRERATKQLQALIKVYNQSIEAAKE